MLKTVGSIFALIVIAGAMAGCDPGGNPSGPSTAEVKKQIDGMSPEKQIQLIQNSPMQPSEKQAKIDEIKKKYNLTDIPAPPVTPGAPQTGATK